MGTGQRAWTFLDFRAEEREKWKDSCSGDLHGLFSGGVSLPWRGRLEIVLATDRDTNRLGSMSRGKGKKNAAKGRRYSIAEKRAVLEFVEKVNRDRGRGGISSAAKHFGVSPLTISNWLRSDGMPTRGTGSRPSADVFRRLAELHDEIVRVESELAAFRKEYARLKNKI